jgi:hypothetical protein
MLQRFRLSRDTIVNSLSVTGGSVILSVYALYNGYPLLYSDSGTYLAACMERFIPRDRPLTYSFFLRHLSLKETLWIPLFIQCLLVSWLIHLVFRNFTSVKNTWPWHLGTIALLTLTTGLAVNADLMLPDIFTSILLLTGAILLFSDKLTKGLRILLLLGYAYAMTTHLSHYPLACALSGILFVVWFFQRKKENAGIFLKRVFVLSAMIPAAIFMTLLLNYSVGKKWQFSPGSGHVFMMNRLIQCGIVEQYLEKNCPTRHTTMCEYRPDKMQDFIWDTTSPLNKHYGWEGWANAKPEYDSIISEIFAEPDYLWQYIRCDLKDATTQLYTFDSKLMPGQQLATPSGVIEWHLPADHPRLLKSKQINQPMPLTLLNSVQRVFVPLMFCILLTILALRKLRKKMPGILPLSLWILAGMIFNALTVVSVAMVDARYQSRLIWIIPLIVCCFIANVVAGKKDERT